MTYDSSLRAYTTDELHIKRFDALNTNRAVLIRDTYFEGGDVLVCHAGRFRFSFRGESEPVEIGSEEILIIYPGNTVTIEALDRSNTLKYAIFGGTGVADFFDSFGFYDRLHFKGNTQEEIFDIAAKESATDVARSLAFIQDALKTFAHCLSTGEKARLHRALYAVHRAVREGAPRVKSICDELSVSRATLNRIFDDAGLKSPSDYLHTVQFRHARQLLQTTTLPIAEIAKTLGFSSSVYFTEFIRKHAGMTPTELRKASL